MRRASCYAFLAATLVASACARPDETLFGAVDRGDLQAVERKLDTGVAIDMTDPGGFTALHKALLRHHHEIARYLVQRGADVNATAFYGVAPLHLVEDAATTRLLLARGARHGAWSKSRATPLHSAADRNLAAVTRVLVDVGAALDAQDNYRSTPLHYAAGKGNQEIVEILLHAGARVDAANVYGYTPLHWAAGNGHTGVVRRLVAAGAAPSAKSEVGTTPLDMAVAGGHRLTADVLSRASAPR